MHIVKRQRSFRATADNLLCSGLTSVPQPKGRGFNSRGGQDLKKDLVGLLLKEGTQVVTGKPASGSAVSRS